MQQTAFDPKTVSLIKGNEVLSKDHLPLLMDRERVCAYAGISLEHLTNSMKKFCTKRDYDFLGGVKKHLRGQGPKGYVVDLEEHPTKKETMDRFRGMAGALARNYISCRVVPTYELRGDSFPEVEVLLLPDFCLSDELQPTWIQDAIANNLYARMINNNLTIVAISSRKQLETRMGTNIYKMVKEYFAE